MLNRKDTASQITGAYKSIQNKFRDLFQLNGYSYYSEEEYLYPVIGAAATG